MGQEVETSVFSESDFNQFHDRLRSEMKTLMQWFREEKFVHEPNVVGMELEAWLLDENYLPNPINKEFLQTTNNDLVVPELSKFNFELNCDPLPIASDVLQTMQTSLQQTWQACQRAAEQHKAHLTHIGVLPTLRDEMLTPEYMSDSKRYEALNKEVMRQRKGRDITIRLRAKDELMVQHQDLMVEAAATSLQVHLQTSQAEAVRYYNASQIASIFTVAVSANSPFFYGKDLWDENRIPIFEQAVRVNSFRDKHGQPVGRVGFGNGFARDSLFEVFLENFDNFPILLPYLSDNTDEDLAHVRFHNGTIWRWNRPIIGVHKSKAPHLRIEHRVTSAGPTLTDVVANIGLYLGLTRYFANLPVAPETELSFESVRDNFYEAAKHSLNAEINWYGKTVSLQGLLLNELIPHALAALKEWGIDKDAAEHYILNVIEPRVIAGLNGAAWQRAFVSTHGHDFQALTQAYIENQQSDKPVHQWKS